MEKNPRFDPYHKCIDFWHAVEHLSVAAEALFTKDGDDAKNWYEKYRRILLESDDGAAVHGGRFTGGTVESCGDHRIAMSFAVAGTIANGPVAVRDVAAVETSFPGFAACLDGIGANIVGMEELPA